MNPLPADILTRIERDFPGPPGAEPLAVLMDLGEQLQSGRFGNVDAARVIRCVVHLAGGDADKLRHNATGALQDWRDVIWWAEYDGGEVRLRDFSRPFDA